MANLSAAEEAVIRDRSLMGYHSYKWRGLRDRWIEGNLEERVQFLRDCAFYDKNMQALMNAVAPGSVDATMKHLLEVVVPRETAELEAERKRKREERALKGAPSLVIEIDDQHFWKYEPNGDARYRTAERGGWTYVAKTYSEYQSSITVTRYKNTDAFWAKFKRDLQKLIVQLHTDNEGYENVDADEDLNLPSVQKRLAWDFFHNYIESFFTFY